MGIKRVVLV